MSPASYARSSRTRRPLRSSVRGKGLGLLGIAGCVATIAWLPGQVQGGASLDAAFGPSKDIWIERDRLVDLPTVGAAWDQLAADARSDWGRADISDQNSSHDVLTFAGALYAVRTNDIAMRGRVTAAIESAVGTEDGGRTLALARNLTGYVLAADLVGYDSPRLSEWLRTVRVEDLDGRTLISTHEERPNNWGTHAGAARIATDRYLGDAQDLARAVEVFRGFLGDRAAYADFRFGDPEWQADESRPVPINPKGTRKDGFVVDGALVDDVRRCGCPVTSPAPRENYQWEAMQGLVTQSQMLRRAGYDDVWSWSDGAMRRAVDFLYVQADFPAAGDDSFLTYLIDTNLGTTYSAGVSDRPGKSIGYTGWTHRGVTAPTNPTTTTIPVITLPATITTTSLPVIVTIPPATTTTTPTTTPATTPATTTQPTTTIPVITLPATTQPVAPATTTTVAPDSATAVGPATMSALAERSELVVGVQTGTHTDTWTRGGGQHSVTELPGTGRRSRAHDRAELRWTIPSMTGEQVLEAVIAVGPDSGDADAGFALEWSSDGSTWTPLATIASDTSIDLVVGIGAPTSDVVVRIIDTNRGKGQNLPDWVSVDFLQVRRVG